MSTESPHRTGYPVPPSADDINAGLEGIAMADHPIPNWWKAWLIVVLLFGALYFIYHHLGATGRSITDRYDVAFARNTQLQFAEIGNLDHDAATLVRMMNDRGWRLVGQTVYRTHCASCHGVDGGGGIAPNLTDEHFKNVRQIEDVLRVVRDGAAGGAMPAWRAQLHNNEQVLVAAYVASLRGATPSGAGKGPEGEVIPPWPTLEEVEAMEEETAVEEETREEEEELEEAVREEEEALRGRS